MRGDRGAVAYRARINVAESLWFVPVLCVGAGVAASFAMLWVDDQFDNQLVSQSFTGGPDTALAILS